MSALLRLVVRTPQQCVLDRALVSVRVPTESGQLGLRARGEALVSVVEPGLIVLRTAEATRHYVASSGGPLRMLGSRCELYTAFAVSGARDDELLRALDRALTAPDSELATRRRIEQLEQQILREARDGRARPRRSVDGRT